MKLAHNVVVNVFSKPEDDEDEIRKALIRLFPFDLGKEKLAVNKQNAVGFNEKKIKIFEVRLKKDSHINYFMKNLKENLGEEQSKRISEETELRIDEKLHFFIRLDKKKLTKKNKYIITDSGNCFHIKASLTVYPKRRERAVELVRGFLASNR